MKAIRTINLKLLTNTDDDKRLDKVCVRYLKAANWLSKIIHRAGKPIGKGKPSVPRTPALSREFYGTVREKFKLTSQLTCSLFRHVTATYRTMKSNKEWNLAVYTRQTVPVCWKRDFNLSGKGLTIWGNPIEYKSRPIPKGIWSDSKLKKVKGVWYLVLTVEVDVPEAKTQGSIVGVDSGIKNLLTAVDTLTGKTLYIKGSKLNHRRLRIRQTRAKVASVGTPSSRQLLKRQGKKEAAVTRELMHVASKQLVAFAVKVGARTIVMEDLTGLKKNVGTRKRNPNRKKRASIGRWPYAMGGFYVGYKAQAQGISFETVPAYNTSRGCPRCGHVAEANRTGLVFRCVACNFTDNADRVGATNVASRSILSRQAEGERGLVNGLIVTSSSLGPLRGNSHGSFSVTSPDPRGRGN